MSDVDPIQLEIIRNALIAASEQMSVTIWRTSRSTVIREMLDYSTAIFDSAGRNIAQATRIPVHLNSMATCLEDVLRDHVPLSEWRDGDVVITNDPYCGGQHLPDILAFRPVYVDGAPIAIVGALCHHIDVGGGAPGNYDPMATEIYQEGLRIPPLKFYQSGVRNEGVHRLILNNSREPEKLAGDLASQMAALEIGAVELTRIARRYGVEPLRTATERIMDQSEQAMRAALRAMPDGVYRFEDVVDDDGFSDAPLPIKVTLTIDGDRAVVDFTGSSPQARGSVNCTLNMSKSAVYFAVMSAAGGDFAANSGCYRPIELIAPAGTVVNCRHPAPVVNRMLTGHRIVNAVMGALAQVVPDRIPAAYYGVSYVYSVGSQKPDGSPDVYLEIEVGGWGGPSGRGRRQRLFRWLPQSRQLAGGNGREQPCRDLQQLWADAGFGRAGPDPRRARSASGVPVGCLVRRTVDQFRALSPSTLRARRRSSGGEGPVGDPPQRPGAGAGLQAVRSRTGARRRGAVGDLGWRRLRRSQIPGTAGRYRATWPMATSRPGRRGKSTATRPTTKPAETG